ncbi:unnamed protein product [Meganyctiphanes norvegica]|uniref:Platelet-derived growth factor (PDGF) family profile domain-containing protein n=1 Tax=Meganyctiphanes norvegica TaxID=48144 RepID=A0AAV2R7D7_MEGNR
MNTISLANIVAVAIMCLNIPLSLAMHRFNHRNLKLHGFDLKTVDHEETVDRGTLDREAVAESYAEFLLMTQMEELNALGCQLRTTVVNVRDQLKTVELQNDKELHPELIAVKRCIPERSFCGDSEGRPTKSCLPIMKHMKEVVVVTSAAQYKIIEVEEHSQCGCQDRRWLETS